MYSINGLREINGDVPEADLWPGISSIAIIQAETNASQWQINSERISAPEEGHFFTLASNNSAQL